MMIGCEPTAARMAAISSGEQTIARAPDCDARLASPTAEVNALAEKPICCTSSSDSEVKIVTPVMYVCGAASTAARIIAPPPDACTVKNLGARCAIAFVAPLTVCGIS